MKGKVAFVTGGAQGIGKSYARELLRNGAKVIIGDINESVGKETVQELKNEFGDNVVFYKCNVTNSQQFRGCFEKALVEFGGLDILINNAGIVNETDNGWRKMIDINLIALVEGTKLGFEFMSTANGGRGGLIVNIASITSLSPWECVPVYSATKAAVNQLSRSYGTDLHYKGSGVKVISINPGLTSTDILNDASTYCISDIVREALPENMAGHPVQGVDNMGKGLIHVIKVAENGSLWTIEDDKPPQLTVLA